MQTGFKVNAANVYTAAIPTLFPNANPKLMKAVIPAMKNIGKNAKGEPILERVQLVFWRKYAEIASLMFPVGTCLIIEGELHTFTRDTGLVGANGKKVYESLTSINVRKFEFGGVTKKQILATINDGIARAKAEGLVPAQVVIGADYLYRPAARPKHRPFNPNEVLSTGTFGYAKVYVKGQGWLGKGAGAVSGAGASQPAPTDIAAKLAALEKEKAELMKAGTAAAGSVNPFPA